MRETANRGRTSSKRARSALVWGISAGVTLQLSLALAVERWLPELRDPEYGLRMERLCRRIVAAPSKPFTIVMLGSSRTSAGFMAGRLERDLRQSLNRPVIAFNFGITGAGPVMENLDLQRLLADNVCPDLLLIEVLPPLLAGQVPHEVCRLPANRLWLREIKSLERYGAAARLMRAGWWEEWPLPWYAHRFAIVSRIAPALLPYQKRMDWASHIDDSGWVDGPRKECSPERRLLATERAREEYSHYFSGFRLAGPGCQALRDLLELCHGRGIQTALVLMPEGTAFQSWYPAGVWSEIEDFLTAVSCEFGAPIINARNWIADDNFADSHHLLPGGAVQFTERLEREAVLPLVRNNANLWFEAGKISARGQPARRFEDTP